MEVCHGYTYYPRRSRQLEQPRGLDRFQNQCGRRGDNTRTSMYVWYHLVPLVQPFTFSIYLDPLLICFLSILLLAVRTGSVDDQLYARYVPDLEEYAKDPPTLPAQLRWIILNGVSVLFCSNLSGTPKNKPFILWFLKRRVKVRRVRELPLILKSYLRHSMFLLITCFALWLR